MQHEFLQNHNQNYSPLPIYLLYAIFSAENKIMTDAHKEVMIIEDEAEAAEMFAEMMRVKGKYFA